MVLTLLDLSRLEKLAMELHKSPTNLVTLVHEAKGLLGSDEAAAMVELDAPDGPVMVPCDPNTIRRVIMNLLDNAVKFSPVDGRVRVAVIPEDSDVHISVSDSGPGVPEAFREKIFDHFAQIDARDYSTGIGLAFCRMAVRAHGGELTLRCPKGGGSTFTVSLPLHETADGS
jgi:NtrC-family two-component system sensor histidine kinase KinB